MPEGLEAEIWRRACEPLVERTIVKVAADARVVPAELRFVAVGAEITAVRRLGKVVLIDTDRATIGLHFAMTGRLIVDGHAPIERLVYASARDATEWDRLSVFTDPGVDEQTPAVRFNDPRRLGHISLDPDLSHLGVDFTAVTPRRLAGALGTRRTAIKSVLLDQSVVAGLGNLCADEVLWWADLDPRRRTDSLSLDDVERLATMIRHRLPTMLRGGGSTCGVLNPDVRAQCPPCERDGAPLQRTVIGGRTAIWCPVHQR